MAFDPRKLLLRNPLPLQTVQRCLTVLTQDWGSQQVARVFDVGCGNGEVLAQLRELRLNQAAADCAVLGIDPDASALELAADRHAALQLLTKAQPTESPRWEATGWQSTSASDGPWQAALCLGSRHAFGTDPMAADRMVNELAERIDAAGKLFLADGYWRREPEAEYLDATGLSKQELEPLHHWHDRFTRAGFELIEEALVSPQEFAEYESPFWQQGGEHWTAWRAAFKRWGHDTMGFAGWVLARA